MSKTIINALGISLTCSVFLGSLQSALGEQDVSALIKKAITLMEQGKAKPAAELLQEATRLSPDNAQAHMQLGAALAGQVRDDNNADTAYDTAILEEQQALKLDPKSFGARIILGHIYANLNKPDKSIPLLKEACELKPNNYGARRDLGIAYQSAGKIDEAIEAYKKATELKPEAAEAHGRLGMMLAGKGLADEGLNQISEAIRLEPGNPENHVAFGNILLESKEPAAAIPPFKAALKINKNHYNALSGLGWANALKDDSKIPEAIANQRTAIKINPGFLPAYRRLAELLSKDGNNKEAEQQYKSALKIAPDDALVRTSYAKFLERTNRKDEARTELKKVLEKSPQFKPASDALAGLEQAGKTK